MFINVTNCFGIVLFLCIAVTNCRQAPEIDCNYVYKFIFEEDFVEEIEGFGFPEYKKKIDTVVEIENDSSLIAELIELHGLSKSFDVWDCLHSSVCLDVKAKTISSKEVIKGNYKYAVGVSNIIKDKKSNKYFLQMAMLCGKLCGYIYIYEFAIENGDIKILKSSFSEI